MDAIPDDILSAAVAVVDRGYNEGLIDAVVKALMAERERCATVALATGSAIIAAAIRSQPPLPTLVEEDKGE